MDWEQLTIIAQIATGAATLAVAVFLASRCTFSVKIQRETLPLRSKIGNRT